MDCAPHDPGSISAIADTLELSLATTDAAPAEARAALGEWLADETGDRATRDIALLLVSEMVTNSIRHAHAEDGQGVRLIARVLRSRIRIELWDAGTDGEVAPRPPRIDGGAESGGFGLGLIETLSSAWGVDRDGNGTTVWIELPTERA